jgi:M6 family metalloprotease-like protein
MKKLIPLLFINFLFFQLAFLPYIANAINANPYPVEFMQPDGSKITILMKGDEKVRWAETMDGYSIMFNRTGTYEYSILNAENNMVPSGVQAKNQDERSVTDKSFLANIQKSLHYSAQQVQMMQSAWNVYTNEAQNAFPTIGNRRLICILIGYTDLAFTKTNAEFSNLFNQINYTTGGATGSVKDFYLESSYNQFNLTVDVAGPYTASNTMAYYGGNDASGNDLRPRELAAEAVTLADPDINYANYDNDNNGSVDGVYVIFAGYGEEGGASSNAIWSHAWNLATTLTLDGKTISKYSCSPELRGTSGSNITYIGVICHEFGHVLGSPDFYDTDYSSSGGQYSGTGTWDLMASGSWNNGGKTPAHHNAYIKTVVYGWASYTTLSAGAHVTLYNAADNLNSFYRFNTTTTNEYYLIENRQQLKFDANIPGHGMIIYHVHSAIGTSGINITHPQKMYPVCASATTNPSATPSDYGSVNSGGCPYPGTGAKTSFTDATTPWAKSWAGANTAKPITSISENITNKTVSFDFMGGVTCTLPTTQAAGFSASSITNNSMTIGWTRGTGNSVLVVARKGSAVNDIPINSLSYTANAVFGNGSEIGTGNYVVYNGTGTSVNITSLLSGTTYYYAIYEYTSSSYCYLTPALTGNALTTGNPPITYCIASATTCDEYIGNVTIGTINNTTACTSGGYADYSAISTNITQGASLAITVANPVPYSADQCGIWVDWNYNGDLTDDGAITVTGSPGGGPYSATITCPANAPLGSIRLRVRVHYNNETTSPCGNAVYGEVEDYSLNVVASCTPPSAPVIGTITQPTCSLATGSVILNGLPATGTWTLTRTPGNVTTTGTGITKTISGLAAGTYTYTVTDAIPCTSVASANVVINTQPITPSAPTAGNNGPVCAGKTLSLTASTVSGATYSWTGPNSFASTLQNPIVSGSATPAMTGTYSVTAIANSCTSQAGTTAVTVNATITPTFNPVAAICSGATLAALPTTSLNGFTGTWAPALSNTVTTTYTFTPGAGQCATTTTMTIIINPIPVLMPSAIPATICNGASSSLSATSSINPATFIWTPGSLNGTPVSVTPASTTTYTITGNVTSTGCTGMSTVSVNVNPKPVITPAATPATICNVASSSLSATSSINPATFIWTPGSLNGTPVSVTPASTTTYTITGNVTATGCTGMSTVSVNVNPKPVITPLATPATINIGASSSLSASSTVSGTTYVWNPGALIGTPVSVTPVSTTTYTITGNASGCTGAASVSVTINPLTKTLQVKVFIEGLYIGNGLMRESSDFNPVNETFPPKWTTGIADTVTVVLYNDSYGSVIAKYPGVYLHTDGTLTITGISSSLSNSYYITLFQRNSVPVTSATPRSFAGSVINYDFTIPIDQAYGAGLAPQKDLGDGFYGMYAGALDQANDPDYLIDVTDLNELEPIVNFGPFGYLDADLDGSGFVDVTDLNLLEPNVNLGPRFWNPLLFAKKHPNINQNK